MSVRTANDADAKAICEVLRQSITQLCVPDHKNEPDALSQWLANKTPENIGMWIANPANKMLVVEADSKIVAVGCATTSGTIALNYVSPDVRLCGVSKMLMAALEALLVEQGSAMATLESTATAHHFYRAIGYEDRDSPDIKHGLQTFPMWKVLSG